MSFSCSVGSRPIELDKKRRGTWCFAIGALHHETTWLGDVVHAYADPAGKIVYNVVSAAKVHPPLQAEDQSNNLRVLGTLIIVVDFCICYFVEVQCFAVDSKQILTPPSN